MTSASVQRQVPRLEQTVRQAYSAGVFGVPTFVVGDEVFWGNDRLVLLRHHLEKEADRD